MKKHSDPGKRRILKKALFLGITAALAAAAGAGIYIYRSDTGTLGRKISVSHLDVSKKTVEEAVEAIQTSFMERKAVFTEDGQKIYETTVGNLGYSLDETALTNVLTGVQKDREKKRKIIASPVNYTVPYQLQKDAEQEKAALAESNFENKERNASVDSEIVYDEQKKQYTATAEVQGTCIDGALLTKYVDETLAAAFEEQLLGNEIVLKLSTEVYQQPVKSASDEIRTKLKSLNDKLSAYRCVTVTYTLGDSTEVLDADRIESWLKIENESVDIDEAAVQTYVEELATKYNTIYVPRVFHTTWSGDVTVSDNEYGFQIDQEEELSQLLADLEGGEPVARDPVYAVSGMKRNGTDDLAGSYIEVSLDNQHLWLYKDGVLITETDIVSGAPTPERETYRGAWPIAYKASPYSLTSDVYGYTCNVNYWMPFVYGQGLHDASWQSGFGGSRYKSGAGSHGCINLPTDQAAVIYENIDGGYPIIIY